MIAGIFMAIFGGSTPCPRKSLESVAAETPRNVVLLSVDPKSPSFMPLIEKIRYFGQFTGYTFAVLGHFCLFLASWGLWVTGALQWF